MGVKDEKTQGPFDRKPLRLGWHDYSQVGGYFVTTCVQGRKKVFARIHDFKSVPTVAGRIVIQTWEKLPKVFPWVSLDAFIVMPDHFHGILWFNGELLSSVPKNKNMPGRLGEALPLVMRYFKSQTTKKIRERGGIREFQWQKSYTDKIIRTEKYLNQVRGYIFCNPLAFNPFQIHGIHD